MMIYGLVAIGAYKNFSSTGRLLSKKVFKHKKAAENYEVEFKNICCDNTITSLHDDAIVKLFEIELVESEE
ncbi:MAG: hypothetical protein ACOYLO_00160 [Ferruginibacter sp.]